MPLTLEDIAKTSGVSRSTVSRVINNDPNVNETTRKKVMEVIKSVNFQPNLAARGLAAGRTHVLGLVIPQGVSAIFTDPFFPTLIQGVSSACNAKDYSVMLWIAEGEYERRTIRQVLYNGLVDGVIVSSMLQSDPIIEALADSKMPFVLVGRYPSKENLNMIDTDNRRGAYDAVSHLLRLGRKRVAIITGPTNMMVTQDRYQGYLDALKEHHMPIHPELIIEGDFSDSGGYLAMKRLLAAEPDAVFAASDATAFGALRALNEAGINVPQQISIVGFDDLPQAAHSNPPLTTMRQPTLQMGMQVAETLIDIIHNPTHQPRRVILATELVIRASCGALQP